MPRDTTPLTRALFALAGLALCVTAGFTTLDATAGLGDPRSVRGAGDPAPIAADEVRSVLPAVADDDRSTVASPVTPFAPAVGDDESGPGRERAAVVGRAPTVATRALLVARSACDLLPQRFVVGCGTTLDGVRMQRVVCSDRQAVSTLAGAGAECALLAGELTANQVRAGLRQQMLGAELFALQVAAAAQPRSLGAEQVRRIFRGELRDWRQLGFAPGPIVPVVPADAAVAERAARALLGGARFAACCVRDDGALPPGGVRLLRFADAVPAATLRLLRVDDVVATPDAFFRGNYAFGLPLQLVTPGAPDRHARQLLAFARSDEGRALLGDALAFAD